MNVTVNDEQYGFGCWICNDPLNHGGRPHSDAVGDGVTRSTIVDIMNANGWLWRRMTCEQCSLEFMENEVVAVAVVGRVEDNVTIICHTGMCLVHFMTDIPPEIARQAMITAMRMN